MTGDQDKLPSDAEDVDLKPRPNNDNATNDNAKETTSEPKDKKDEEGPSEQPS